jgi:hypothetical protein
MYVMCSTKGATGVRYGQRACVFVRLFVTLSRSDPQESIMAVGSFSFDVGISGLSTLA